MKESNLPNLRRYLLAGLVVTIPVMVTLFVLNLLYVQLKVRIGDPVQLYLAAHIDWLRQDQPLIAVTVGLLLTLTLLMLVGFISTTMVGRKLVGLGEAAMQRTPLVGRIYAPARQAVQLLFANTKPSFRRVVLVPYPQQGSYALGFVTAEQVAEASAKVGGPLINVFVPFSPTPVTGIVLMVRREDVRELDMTIEQGMKMVISGGVLTPDTEQQRSGDTTWESG